MDEGIPSGRNHAHGIEADGLQMARQPIGAASNIFAVLRLRADAGKVQKLLKLGDKSGTVSASIVESTAWIHGSSRNSPPRQREPGGSRRRGAGPGQTSNSNSRAGARCGETPAFCRPFALTGVG